MSPKTHRILFFVFLVLVLFTTFPYWKSYIGFLNPAAKVVELDLANFYDSNTTKIIFKKSSDEIVLSKEGSSWKVASYSASRQQIDDLFTSFKNLEFVNLVSKNPQNQDEYRVGSQSATILTVFNSSGQKTLAIGKQTQDIGDFYLRNTQSDAVYIVKGTLLDMAGKSISDWRDKTIIVLDKTKVKKIVVSGSKNFTLEEKDNIWKINSPGQVKDLTATESSSLIESVVNIQATSFTDETEKTDFKNGPTTKITIFSGNDEKVAELNILIKDSDVWVQPQGQAEVYKVSASALAPLLNSSDSLK